VRLISPRFLAIAQLLQRWLDPPVQLDHLPLSRSHAQPDRAGPLRVGKRPGPADLQLERGRLAHRALHRPAHLVDLPGVDVAQELERHVEVFWVDPSRVGPGGAQLVDQFGRTATDGRIDLHGHKGADSLFHRLGLV